MMIVGYFADALLSQLPDEAICFFINLAAGSSSNHEIIKSHSKNQFYETD